MRLRNIKGSREVIAASKYTIAEERQHGTSFEERYSWSVKGKWAEVFGNDHPVRIEIGMGKGAFLMELARRNPGINYVGIEKYSSVLLRAVQKQDAEELPNVRLIRMEAENIKDVFAPGEVDRIYLNFSDPWPKDAHAGRRLTSRQFLARYQDILKEQGMIEFKTDNRELFAFSLEEAREAGWEICAVTEDLHRDPDHQKIFDFLFQKRGKFVDFIRLVHDLDHQRMRQPEIKKLRRDDRRIRAEPPDPAENRRPRQSFFTCPAGDPFRGFLIVFPGVFLHIDLQQNCPVLKYACHVSFPFFVSHFLYFLK